MAELTIDMTYGTALYEAARDTGKTEIIMEEAKSFPLMQKMEGASCDFPVKKHQGQEC